MGALLRAALAILSLASTGLARVCLDCPHVPLASAGAATTDPWQWWYFDMVSNDASALQVVFYSAYGFGPLVPAPYYVQISATLPNGTSVRSWGISPGLGAVNASGAYYSNGSWPGLGGWTATTAGAYAVNFASNTGTIISGSLRLQERAPPHYPCNDATDPTFDPSAAYPNLAGPLLGWANAVPDATATATITVLGETFTFTGSGYHDSNFGIEPLPSFVDSWYWGRASTASYSAVWFAYLPKNSTLPADDPSAWYTAGYLARAGALVENFCSAEQTRAQHAQANFAMSPVVVDPADNSTALVLTFTEGQAMYRFNITSTRVALSGTSVVPYTRWLTAVKGGMVGGPSEQGVGVFENLDYGP